MTLEPGTLLTTTTTRKVDESLKVTALNYNPGALKANPVVKIQTKTIMIVTKAKVEMSRPPHE